ncbi:MAG: twin-arginine translocase TatA/TatE family subunit [bacterium]|nr:twin-arginine translocase TatA/TatE family subunit [bacterium]
MFGNLGIGELIIILVIALIIFGPGKLPEVGKALGKGVNNFKKAMNGEDEEDKKAKENSAKTTEDKKELKG